MGSSGEDLKKGKAVGRKRKSWELAVEATALRKGSPWETEKEYSGQTRETKRGGCSLKFLGSSSSAWGGCVLLGFKPEPSLWHLDFRESAFLCQRLMRSHLAQTACLKAKSWPGRSSSPGSLPSLSSQSCFVHCWYLDETKLFKLKRHRIGGSFSCVMFVTIGVCCFTLKNKTSRLWI